MPLVYTKDEIKVYLAQRGFDVNDEETLNKFIHDLKKLIKYEERQRRRVALGHDPQETNLESTTDGEHITGGTAGQDSSIAHDQHHHHQQQQQQQQHHKSHDYDQKENVGPDGFEESRTSYYGEHSRDFADGHRQPQHQIHSSTNSARKFERQLDGKTVSNRRFVPVLDNQHHLRIRDRNEIRGQQRISEQQSQVQQRPKTAPAAKTRSVDRPPPPVDKSSSGIAGSEMSSRGNTNTTHDETSDLLLILGSILGDDDSERGSESTRKTIKGPPNCVKRDPVSLYHYYKKIWDKQSFPGQNRHMQLRWNVRAQTVGNYPCVDGQPVKYLK